MARSFRLLGRIILGITAVLLGLLAIAWLSAAWRERETAVPAGTTFFPSPIGRMAAAVSGPPAGTPVLIVPGTAGWSGFWRDVSAHLAARGYRVIAADLPPFGYSDRDAQARYDRASQAARLSALAGAAAGKRPAIVLAHSFGAGAATEFALRYPGQVSRLVLVDAALGTLDPAPAAPGLTARALAQPAIGQPLVAASLANPLALKPLLRSMLARKEAADGWIPTLRLPMRRPGTTAGYAAWAPALFATDDGGWSRRRARLRAIAPPVALIWGAADTVTPIAQGEELAQLMHARSFARLPGVGHIPHIEDPTHFIAALDAALAEKQQ